jgi:hypothetical protein
LTDGELRQEIVTKLGAAFGGACDVTLADNQPPHVLLAALELPSGWTPNPTRALTIWDGWPGARPTFYVEPTIQGPNGRVPQNPSDAFLLGETWRTFSFSFAWNGDDAVRAIQLWLTIFDKERPG